MEKWLPVSCKNESSLTHSLTHGSPSRTTKTSVTQPKVGCTDAATLWAYDSRSWIRSSNNNNNNQVYLYCVCPYINVFALGTLQHELRQRENVKKNHKKQNKKQKQQHQSPCYKVKVITLTLVQTEYNNILRTPNSHGPDASGPGLAGASPQRPEHPCGQPVAGRCGQWQGSPTQGRVCHKKMHNMH